MGLLVTMVFFAVIAAVATAAILRSHRVAHSRRREEEKRAKESLDHGVDVFFQAASEDDPLPAANRAVQRDPARAAQVVSKMMRSED